MNEISRLQKNLPALRAAAHWSAQEFADMLGITRQTVNNLEKGEESGTAMSKIQYLAIRSLLTYEIEKNQNDRLKKLMYFLVDHPEELSEENQEILSRQAKMLSSAVKGGASNAEVDDTWNSLLHMLGIASISIAIGSAAAWIDSYLNRK